MMREDARKNNRLSGRLRCVGAVGKAMAEHYSGLYDASSSKSAPVAWVSSVGPVELLVSMGFETYFPENHAAMLGARRQARQMGRAQAQGYSPDICAYLRSDIGAYLAGETALSALDSRFRAPPTPDVLVYSTNQCRDIKEWFRWYGERFQVPCIGIESPVNVDELTPAHIDAVSRQIQALVPELSRISGQPFDPERLKDVVAQSRRCSNLWASILKVNVSRPAPLSFKDALTLMGPAVVMRGREAATNLYEQALAELTTRQTDGVGAQKRESYRIYWDGMPIWGRLGDLDRLFKDTGVATVASTYCSSWVFQDLDPFEPFESMARAYTSLFIVRSEKAKASYLKQAARAFGVDGFVFHEAKTCPANSNTRYGMPERLSRDLGLPHVTVYGDHVDLDQVDGERIATQIEAMAEQMEARGR